MLVLFFGSRGLKETVAADIAMALRVIRDRLPSLILLDVGPPDVDVCEPIQKFRKSVRPRYIPLIFLTGRGQKSERIAGLRLGADDLIAKRFDLKEIHLRVHNPAKRAERANLSDTRTALSARKVSREKVAGATRVVCEFRLGHGSEFRDQHGTLAGSDLLRPTALMMNPVLNTVGTPENFRARFSEETFAVIPAPEQVELIRKHFLDRFNHDASRHYAIGERVTNRVKVEDSGGREQLVPLLDLEAALAR